MEPSPTVQLALLDWRELQLYTAVILDMYCLIEEGEHVSLIEHGVKWTLLVYVRCYKINYHARPYFNDLVCFCVMCVYKIHNLSRIQQPVLTSHTSPMEPSLTVRLALLD